MARPALLFLSPTTPAPTGNGRAMRAFRFLQAYAPRHRIDLVVAGEQAPAGAAAPLAGLVHRVAFLPFPRGARCWRGKLLHRFWPDRFYDRFQAPRAWTLAAGSRPDRLPPVFRAARYDRVHVFRLYLLPVAQRLLGEGFARTAHLDFDDIESLANARLARLHRRNGQAAMARRHHREAELYDRLERAWLPRFGRVFVCSATDRKRLAGRVPAGRVAVVPNVVAVPASPPPEPDPKAGAPFRFLFVGSLGYAPNRDGITWFATEVLPRLRAAAPGPFTVQVVGGGLDRRSRRRLAACPELELSGFLEDLVAAYRAADAVLVPLRAGGGTRIKILEAFAHRRPVLATTLGAEGLRVADGRHLLRADTAGAFAAGCAALMRSPALRRALARNARDLVQARYDAARLAGRLACLLGEPAAGEPAAVSAPAGSPRR